MHPLVLGLVLPCGCVDESDPVVYLLTCTVDMSGYEDVRDVLHGHVVLLLGCEGVPLTVDRCEMASDAHLLHDLERIIVCELLHTCDPIIHALAVVCQDGPALDVQVDGVSDHQDVGIEGLREHGVQRRLRFRQTCGIVVSGMDDHLDVVRDVLQVF